MKIFYDSSGKKTYYVSESKPIDDFYKTLKKISEVYMCIHSNICAGLASHYAKTTVN